jgi:hypothetical protein
MTSREQRRGTKSKPKKEAFDALEFKRKAQARLRRETKGMTHAEEIAYLEKKAEEGELGAWWRSLKKASPLVRERPPRRPAGG